ncbi:MAG TPA: TolC family protein [Candidatus Eisenbacteria bacterium]|nr:TolC family protein [Candidatus Eisenbacteria bacterium]
MKRAGARPRRSRRAGPLLGVAALAAVFAFTAASALDVRTARAETRSLTLAEAVALARSQAPAMKIARARALEAKRKSQGAFTDWLPKLATEATYSISDEPQNLRIPAGTLGSFPATGPIPAEDVALQQGGDDLFFITTTLSQPLTQLLKVGGAHSIARAGSRAAQADLRAAENSMLVSLQGAYGALLVATRRSEAAALNARATSDLLTDAERGVAAGTSHPVQAAEARVRALDARRREIEAANEIEDRAADLCLILGLPVGTTFDLAPLDPAPTDSLPLAETTARALAANPEIHAARETLNQARRAVGIARSDFVPQLGLYAQHTYQDAVPFLPEESVSYGFKVEWTVWDFWKRGFEVGARQAARLQAEENLAVVTRRVAADVEKAHRRLRRAALLVEAARAARDARAEAARLRADQTGAGLVLGSSGLQAEAERVSAEADLLAAELEQRIARAELQRATGSVTP